MFFCVLILIPEFLISDFGLFEILPTAPSNNMTLLIIHPSITPSIRPSHIFQTEFLRYTIPKLYLIQWRKSPFLRKGFEAEKRVGHILTAKYTSVCECCKNTFPAGPEAYVKTWKVLRHASWIIINPYWIHVSSPADVELSAQTTWFRLKLEICLVHKWPRPQKAINYHASHNF